MEAYPDVSVEELAKDPLFDEYAQGKIGTIPLKDIYAGYRSYIGKIEAAARSAAESELLVKTARAAAATGPLKDMSSKQSDDMLTIDQLRAMTPEQIEAYGIEKARAIIAKASKKK